MQETAAAEAAIRRHIGGTALPTFMDANRNGAGAAVRRTPWSATGFCVDGVIVMKSRAIPYCIRVLSGQPEGSAFKFMEQCPADRTYEDLFD